MEKLPSFLVTGASSGIGLATAQLLSQSGYRVFAGVRRFSEPPKDSGSTLQEIILDVSKADSIAAALQEIESRLEGEGLAGLVNNAGVADIVPLEFNPVEKLRQIFEVNLFGVIAVTQAFLPLIHRARGRIVNIGSIGGMVSIPFGASLCGSKHAIEAISDCLRLELYSAGIAVTCIQPASINSGSAEKLGAQNEKTIAALPPEGQSRYTEMLRKFMKVTLDSETKGSPPSVVAEAVLDVLHAEKPPARRIVGKDAHLLKFIGCYLPDFVRDFLFRKLFLGDPAFGSHPAQLP